RVLLFGDQVVDKLPAVKNLYQHSRTRPQLRRFLKDATDIIKYHLATLTLAEKQRFGHFEDLLGLAESYTLQEHPDEICGATLITAAQIGELLFSSNVYQLGFCVGLLAASVASAARDTSHVVTMGVEAVAISFRLGRELTRRARLIQDTDHSWGCTFVGCSPESLQKRLDRFNESLPLPRRLYLGITTRSWSTVFGPPSTLQLLDTGEDFNDVGMSPLKAAIAVHAAHLSPVDVQVIVGDSPLLESSLQVQTCVSSSMCTHFEASTLRELLHLAVNEVAQRPLLMDKSVQTLGETIGYSGVSNINLTTIGPTPHTDRVRNLLQQSTGETVILDEDVKPPAAARDGLYDGDSGLVAIVGMSGRFPQSNSLHEFWDVLQAGIDTHQEIPVSRFPIDQFYDESGEGKNSTKARFGCFLKGPGLFDHRLFNISPREALQMDPLQRMLLMTTYEALEMAGYPGSGVEESSRVATYFGQTTEDWRTINDQQGCDTHYLPGSNRAFAPGRVSHYFKWGGGFYSVDTACSSSSTSLYLACNALMSGECDMGVVGGGSLLMLPELYSGLSRGGFLSSTGGCKTYADNADGYCRGEAVGVVVLKRLEDALRDNDNVQAVVRGAARNSNAGAGSITYPGEDAQKALFHRLLKKAGVDAAQVSFIEMHGTGTQVGDQVEMNTVRSVFAQSRSPENPLYVGAVKANVGHSEAAAGVVSLIKSVLMLQRHIIPPQPGYPFVLNHRFSDLEATNIKIADGQSYLVDGSKGDGKRRIVINGFDAAGGNTSILIEDAPGRPLKQVDARRYHIVACSARTPSSLAANQSRLAAFLTENPATSLAHLAYTTTARRMQEVCRAAFVVDSIGDLVDHLQASSTKITPPSKAASSPLVFIFTGQSSQYTGMGSKLYSSSPRFRQSLDTFEALCSHNGLASWIDIVRGTQAVSEASPTQLQMAIVALEIALARYWQSLGLQPGLIIGHSLGEYAALCVAGVLSVSDTFHLVHERSRLMEQRCEVNQHSMLAVPLAVSSPELRDLLRGNGASSCEVACINSPSSTVISGLSSELDDLMAALKSKKIVGTKLQVPYGFHSAQMDSIVDDFEAAAKLVSFGKPIIPVISTLTGAREDQFDASYLARQIRCPVNFIGAIQACNAEGLIRQESVILEVGPHPVCLGLVASCLPDLEITCLASLRRGQDDWKSISTCMAASHQSRLPVNWQEFHKDHLGTLRLLDLPFYAFDLKDFWVSYQIQAPAPPLTLSSPRANPAFSSTSLQSLEYLSDDKSSVTFASYTSEAGLYKAIQGHIVDGLAICPAAVFVDMAYTATKFLLGQNGIEVAPALLELVALNMTSPLVVPRQNDEQVVHVTATLDESKSAVSVRFSSSVLGSMAEHGTCQVLVYDSTTGGHSEWPRMQRLVKGRVNHLITSSSTGTTHRMSKALMYKLFANLVDYDSSYQSLEDVYIDETFDDAAGRMRLSSLSLGRFTYSPYSVDALVHLAGFLLNGDLKKSSDDLHIANHIGRMQIMGELKDDRMLTCYAAVRERTSKGASLCDVYVFDDVELVAYCTDIRFQKLTRAFFGSLTGKASHVVSPPLIEVRPVQHMSRRRTSCSSSFSSADDISISVAGSGVSTSRTSIDITDTCATLLDIVAEKTGASVEDMSPDNTFTDMGVDSQMSIAILTDFKKHSGTELPASFFTSFPSIADVKKELGAPAAQPQNPVEKEMGNRRDEGAQSKPGHPRPGQKVTQMSETLLQIVATELGIDMNELSPSTNFTSAGVDSMISIQILSQFKKKTGTELPAAFFNNHQIVSEVREELDGHSPAPAQTSNPRKTAAAMPKPQPESRAILIQGSARSTESPLFLVTDGSGAVAAYIHLPPLPNGRRIYALESPFLERPQDYTLTIQEMAQVFIKSIRKIQQRGPYLIGGWSAGSIYAYEMAWQLAAVESETITGLMLLDMRVPHSVPDASEVTMAFVESTGAFTGVERAGSFLQGLSDRQKMHLTSTVRALIRYDPLPFPEGKQPMLTHVIWATKGLNDSPNPAEHDDRITGPAAMGPCGDGKAMSDMSMEEFELELKSWFFAKRYDFGTNGWERFVGDSIVVRKVGGDHFSMVAPPIVKDLGNVVLEAVESYVKL
ncbi:BcPKS15, polyketide synthase, partial [Xylariales sp. AK1849]